MYLMRINYRTQFLLRQGPISGRIRRGHGPDVTTAFIFYFSSVFVIEIIKFRAGNNVL